MKILYIMSEVCRYEDTLVCRASIRSLARSFVRSSVCPSVRDAADCDGGKIEEAGSAHDYEESTRRPVVGGPSCNRTLLASMYVIVSIGGALGLSANGLFAIN